ncbi:MAG: hypothetical protein IPL53_25595, partial [Ignavibacteria bacterium]|nr:hypothetical protein [Ignavibacteria bacterium]
RDEFSIELKHVGDIGCAGKAKAGKGLPVNVIKYYFHAENLTLLCIVLEDKVTHRQCGLFLPRY